MPVNLTVLYPQTENYKFDEEYYKNTHMPLVEKKFGPHGLQTWRISKLASADPSAKSPYGIQADLIFPSAEHVKAALKEGGPEVLGDIPNFTNVEAVIMVGEVFGTGEGKK